MKWRDLIVQFLNNPNDLSLETEARVTVLYRDPDTGAAAVQQVAPVERVSFTGEIIAAGNKLSPKEKRP